MLRFVVLTHDHPFPHWDFLLEDGAACRTWRLLEEPGTGRTVPAEPIAEHRLHYLNYEGPVSGGRGHVARWDSGTFAWRNAGPDRIEIELSGQHLNGRCIIAASNGDPLRMACTFADVECVPGKG